MDHLNDRIQAQTDVLIAMIVWNPQMDAMKSIEPIPRSRRGLSGWIGRGEAGLKGKRLPESGMKDDRAKPMISAV